MKYLKMQPVAVAALACLATAINDRLLAQAPAKGTGTQTVPFARVIDANTLEVYIKGAQTGVRIVGIDVLQGNTPCGKQASAVLKTLVKAGLQLEEDPDPDLVF